ncbi:DNA-directed RNA polymerase subunit E'' [Thermogladius calderae 1633]|uniref:Transcription elongation factor Spt4 n=1 Tax=Thermogladius calderae (strain DSM 22663 / VKM B-2946 / 1633) TaxID=1184251 RepID=I3TDY6_THEC1|nr:transcription elongation factor subunit Spt4 [Thermogladius calderae]AFK50974.1 DNA-directed RNA polymerase subunit E'' [Thermogladius calderae 1633]
MSTRGKPFKVCRKCKTLVDKKAEVCPVCGSKDFSEEWEGVVVVIDPAKSSISKELELTKPGRYAIKVV